MIKLQCIGNLGGDATTNIVNGKQVINFSVCHTEKWKDATGQQKEKSLWVSCSWWNDSQNVIPYLKKGQQIFAEGIPDVRNYTDSRGQSVAQQTMRIISLNLLGGPKQQSPGQPAAQTDDISNPSVNDDLPY